MGKPYSIPKEDYIVRSAKTWFSQPGSQRSDSGLSAMVEMHRIVVSRRPPPSLRASADSSYSQGRIIDTLYSDTRSVSGLNAHLDYPLLSTLRLRHVFDRFADRTFYPQCAPSSANSINGAQTGPTASLWIRFETTCEVSLPVLLLLLPSHSL